MSVKIAGLMTMKIDNPSQFLRPATSVPSQIYPMRLRISPWLWFSSADREIRGTRLVANHFSRRWFHCRTWWIRECSLWRRLGPDHQLQGINGVLVICWQSHRGYRRHRCCGTMPSRNCSGNCSDLWGSTGHQASHRGAAKHGICFASRLVPSNVNSYLLWSRLH